MRANGPRDTKPEVAVRSLLHRQGLRFRKNLRPEPQHRYRADVVFPTERVAVFVDGCFWHGCPEHGARPKRNRDYWDAKFARNQERDKRAREVLETHGWAVIRAWEHQAVDEVAALVASIVLDRRSAT